MDRRTVLTGAAIAVAFGANRAEAAGPDHSGHAHHGEHPHAALIATASACAAQGQICVDHCLDLLAGGDKAMAACAKSAEVMIAACTALVRFAAQQSKLTKDMAAVCAKACADCEAECRKHEKTHAVCKACAESCAKCAAECKKVA